MQINRTQYLTLGLLCFCAFSSWGQTYEQFKTRRAFSAQDVGSLNLHLSGTQFFKNNEYFNDYTEGFTGIGFFIQPKLRYKYNAKTEFIAGLHIQKFAGQDKLSRTIPLFSIDHKINDEFRVIVGAIDGAMNHGLLEPFYRMDRYYLNHVEYGGQLLYNLEFLKGEVWVNWAQYFEKGGTDQELIYIGTNSNLVLGSTENLRFEMPIQIVGSHRGGQGGSFILPMYSMFDMALGFRGKMDLGLEKHLQVGVHGIYHLEKSNLVSGYVSGYKEGRGVLSQVQYTTGKHNWELGFWRGHRFATPAGEYLFASDSDFRSYILQENRQLITFKYGCDAQLGKGLSGNFRADIYADPVVGDIAFGVGSFLFFDARFGLGKKEFRTVQ
ncbi:MAG: hypothetical protein ACJAY8_001474 [Sphingobacteriales bacterium]|jgi:hypothetical protein